VGDTVTYPDGSEAVIIDGAGFGLVCDNKPAALVGSRLSNGDKIIETLQPNGFGLDASRSIVGLFDPDYVAPPYVPSSAAAGGQSIH